MLFVLLFVQLLLRVRAAAAAGAFRSPTSLPLLTFQNVVAANSVVCAAVFLNVLGQLQAALATCSPKPRRPLLVP